MVRVSKRADGRAESGSGSGRSNLQEREDEDEMVPGE